MNLFEVLKPFEKEEDANKKKAILVDINTKFDTSDMYTLFGLKKNQLIASGLSELHQAFRNLSFKIHTDKIREDLPYYAVAGDLFKKLSDARDRIRIDIEKAKTYTQKQNETSQKQSNNNNNNHKNKNQSKNYANFSHDSTQFNQHPHVSPYYAYYRNLFNNPGFFHAGEFYGTNFANVPPNFYPYPPNMNPGGAPSFFKPSQPSPSTDVAPTIFEEIAKNHIKTHKLDGKLIVNGSVYGQLICTHLGEVHIMGQVTGNLVAKRAHVIVHGVVTGNIKSEYGSITVMNNVSGNIINVHATNTINGDLLVAGSVTNQKGCNFITGQALGSINNITGINYYHANVSDGHGSYQNNNFSM